MTTQSKRIPFLMSDLDQPLQSAKVEIVQGMTYLFDRYEKPGHWELEDTAEFSYQNDASQQYIQLNYFLCEPSSSLKKQSAIQTNYIDIVRLRFGHDYLQQFAASTHSNSYSDELLSFTKQGRVIQSVQLCARTSQCLDALRQNAFANQLEKILVLAQSQMLLLYAIEDCMPNEMDNHLVCKFLTNEVDQSKITLAKEILLKHLGNPITIKELSRKVAMNECYLKKGFKEIVGCTIFEFYQRERMGYATRMLREQGLNVTEVSNLLGYSSISHFSTAFKKHTGLKPCELLLR